jgi:hypothetical protein
MLIEMNGGWLKSKTWIVIVGALAILILGGLAFQLLTGGSVGSLFNSFHPDSGAVTAFAGSESCVGCHQAEARLWSASQHKHAMDHATDKSVLGDFGNANFDYNGVHSRFFRDGDKFNVETDGPDGKLATYEVKYTFGIDPLQQYLVEFPDGRLQALSIAWDSRPKDKGGATLVSPVSERSHQP